MPSITLTHTIKDLRIYIDGILHVHLLSDKYVGLQSWIDGGAKYCIELTVSEGKNIKMEYENKQTWVAILKLLDENM
jgi:hypothetical protein